MLQNVKKIAEQTSLSPIVLLLSNDHALAKLAIRIVKRPWKLVCRPADKYAGRGLFALPNVRLVILDDQAVEESDRGWLLEQIRKQFSAPPLLYVAGSQSDANEKRARTKGAHYYVSKPLSIDRFGQVLQSFLQVKQAERHHASLSPAGKSFVTADQPSDPGSGHGETEIRYLSEELNREGSQLRACLLDAALAGLRLARNPESPELRRDAAKIWAAIQPTLSRHLDAQDGRLLPWLVQQGRLSAEAGRKVRTLHDRLRTLSGAIAETGEIRLTEAQARDAGRALSGLAVFLDDAIENEECKLFPTIQKALFGIDRHY